MESEDARFSLAQLLAWLLGSRHPASLSQVDPPTSGLESDASDPKKQAWGEALGRGRRTQLGAGGAGWGWLHVCGPCLGSGEVTPPRASLGGSCL